MTSKTELRQQMRRRLAAWSQEQREQEASRIHATLATLPELTRSKSVMAYAALPDEVPTGPILERLATMGIPTFLPRIANGRIEPVPMTRLDDLRAGRFGLMEPVGPAVDAADVGVAIVPGLAFDRCGGRLGRGGAYFDRFLAKFNGTSLGLSYSIQLIDEVPMELHDVPVDIVITADETIRRRR